MSWPWLISKLQMGLYPDDGALAGMCLIDKAKRVNLYQGEVCGSHLGFPLTKI